MRGKLASSVSLTLLAVTWLAMLLLGGSRSATDRIVLGLFYADENPDLAGAARLLTDLGGWELLTLFGALFAAYLFSRGERRSALLFVFIVGSGRLLVWAQKLVSARARPEDEHLVTVTSLSFPSGHSANSAITYFTMVLLLTPLLRNDRTKLALFVAAALLCIAIGLSRMILGVHWPSDVLGGWSFGLFWIFALARLADRTGMFGRSTKGD